MKIESSADQQVDFLVPLKHPAALLLPTLTRSAQDVFRRLVADGPATRPQIGAVLGLSRPTMSAAIDELEKIGFVEQIGAIQGPLGRSAAQYRIGASVGHVIAVDAGSTHVRLRVSTLDRRLLHTRVYRLAESQFVMSDEISRAVAEEVQAATSEASSDWGPLRALGVALPTRVVGPEGDAELTRQNGIFAHFTRPEDVEVVLENNVNCAAVAEQKYGAARGRSTFAYVQIGLKVGMGLVIDDRLIRGINGAAGEIGHVAFPFAPGVTPETASVERYLGSEAFIQRVRAGWSDPDHPAPASAADLVLLAENGVSVAVEAVERHAREIGALVATCVSVTDPGLVVLGGGFGAWPGLRPTVGELVNRLAYPTEVTSTLLGAEATVLGIEWLTIQQCVAHLMSNGS
ncbi:ROK family transcriptional regulator [Sinirhodobacter populi]|uniref:ROK family transcriptional regulator n=1 Tax=Paenirhodobacter populi TaxID=2306993 RepID=A0A443JZG9_9RHOB|nr:ROK family transcriptional regulator [Sinirhodobacter populi]RWR25918.1 ROK family transcriptional regulator [Sinirhodobacter populi]